MSMAQKDIKVLMTGATGMVGGEVLKACLDRTDVSRVVSILRRPSGKDHPKMKEIIHQDFTQYTGLEEDFSSADLVFFCLAAYQGKMPKEEYRRVTVDFVNSFARTYREFNPQGVFCLFGAAGADPGEKSRMQFARDKGAAENAVFSYGFTKAYAFRPGFIYPVEKRREPSPVYYLVRFLYPLLKAIYSNGVITSAELAQVMVHVGIHGGDQQVYENKDMKRLLQTVHNLQES
jgi:nucleoside-diphosphate-sugar epimerase